MKKELPKISKKKELHLTRPPRLEGKVKNAMMNPVRKKKKSKTKRSKGFKEKQD